MDVVVRCRKHTRTGNILYAVINSYRKKYTLLTQSELKSLRKIRIHQKSAKNTPFCQNCKRNVFYIILSYYRRTQNYINTYDEAYPKMTKSQVVQCKKSLITVHSVTWKSKKTQDHLNAYAADGTTTTLTFHFVCARFTEPLVATWH